MIEGLLEEGLAALGVEFPGGAPSLLDEYVRRLLEKNRVMNLTAITDPFEAARLHVLDSAALLRYADFSGRSLIDVGSGAGFPGAALKILAPSLEVTLLDAQEKRTRWLSETCGALGLRGIRAVHGRAEELGRDGAFRERFDLAAARAVAALPALCELCLPFLRIGGRFLAMKSVGCREEMEAAARALELLGGQTAAVEDYLLPGTDVRHRVIVIEKVRPCPEKYPRSFGKIRKAPL